MNGINNIHAPITTLPTTTIEGPSIDTSYITPDALMAYCEARLHGLDTQMNDYFQEQQSDNTKMQAWNAISAGAATLAQGVSLANGHDASNFLATIQAQIDSCPDPALKQQLIAYRDNVAQTIGGTGLVAKLDSSDPGADATIAAMKSATPGDAAYLQDTNNHCTPPTLADGSCGIAPEKVAGWQSDIKNDTDALNSASQMGMIQLQSLMSDRQTALQMCTNLVQSLGDQSKQIAENVGK